VIVIAWVADELPSALGSIFRKGTKQLLIQCSGYDDSQRAIWGDKTLAIYRSAKFVGKTAQNANFGVARP
jgi:hypothetical protein